MLKDATVNPNHRRRSIRLKGRDYSGFGTYFVTICTFRRECVLAAIHNETLSHLPIGEIVRSTWLWLAERYSFVDLDIFVVMPNHIHGIITIHDDVSATRPKPLGQLIGAFKAVAASKTRVMLGNPDYVLWQRNYYERAVRYEAELKAMRQYIVSNPANWALDEHYWSWE